MLFGKNVILVFDNIKNYLKSIQRWFFDLNAKTEKKQVTFNGKPQKYWWSTNVYKSYQLRNGLSNTKLRRTAIVSRSVTLNVIYIGKVWTNG